MPDKHTKTDSGSIIAEEMIITGEVEFQGRIQLNGTVKGMLRGDEATIGRTGHLEGGAVLQNLCCHGTIRGQVVCTRLQLSSTAVCAGMISARQMDMQAGASLAAELIVNKTSEPRGLAAGPAEKPPEESPLRESLPLTLMAGSRFILVVSDDPHSRRSFYLDLQEQLADRFRTVALSDPSGSVRELLIRVADCLQIPLSDHGNQAQVIDEIEAGLRASDGAARPVVLLVDNGEQMYPATLEGILQHLAAEQRGGKALMQVILLGGSQLKKMLNHEAADLQVREPDCILEL